MSSVMHSACYSHPLLPLWLLVFVEMTKATTADATDTNVSSNSPAPVNCNSSGIIAGMIVMAIIFLVCLWRKQQKQGKARLDSTRTTAGNGFWLCTLPKELVDKNTKWPTAAASSGYKEDLEYATWQIRFFLLCLVLHSTSAQVVPSSFTISAEAVSVNGSSAIGHCSRAVTVSGTFSRCNDPNSSVLFDGNIPTLTGLDGDKWASQLLTPRGTGSALDIVFDFSGTPDFTRVRRMEVVMFNCPEWGIGTHTIRVRAENVGQAAHGVSRDHPVHHASCDSLVRLCLPVSTRLPMIILQFFPAPGSNWVHLAEVTFYGDGDVNTAPTCTPGPINTTVTSQTTLATSTETNDVQPSSHLPDPSTATSTDESNSIPSSPSPSSSLAGIIAGMVVVVILTAAAIIVVIVILVCFKKKKQKQGKARLYSSRTTKPTGPEEAINDIGMNVREREITTGERSEGRDPDPFPAGRCDETGQVTQEDTYDVLWEHDRQGTMDSGAQQTYSRLDVPNRPRVASETSDPMYSTVAAKPGRERTATSPTDVYAVVDKKKKQPKLPKPYQTDLYSVVSKPAAPPVPIKSPALTDYLESKSVPEDSPDREFSS